jgi:hypothetical protein
MDLPNTQKRNVNMQKTQVVEMTGVVYVHNYMHTWVEYNTYVNVCKRQSVKTVEDSGVSKGGS